MSPISATVAEPSRPGTADAGPLDMGSARRVVALPSSPDASPHSDAQKEYAVQTQHVLTLNRDVPTEVLDRVLTAVEGVYDEIADSRTWIESTHRDIVVMAEVPAPSVTLV
jgi:hypothetical protein